MNGGIFLKEQIYFGTYTKKTSQGIYHAFLDTDTAQVSTPQVAITVENPTYLTITDQTLLTVAKEGPLGGIAAYELADDSYVLTDDALVAGPNPCYVAFDKKRSLVYTANYHKGQIDVYRLNNDKTLTLCDSVVQTGYGPRKEQDGSHVHYTNLTPDGRLVVVDLGNDTVSTYDISAEGKLAPVSILKTKAGLGPRHLVFAPDKKTAYLVGELSSTVSVLDYDLTTGAFHLLQTVSTIPDDWTEHNGAAAIRISNDGLFVYVSNRGHNSLAVFEVLDGELKLIQHLTTHGDFPRDFALDPTERFILVANQNTDNATLYTRDQETGLLACCQKDIPLPEGVCVYFK